MDGHLLDGFLGRSFFLVGFVLFFVPVAEDFYRHNGSAPADTRIATYWGGALLVAGLVISLFAVVLSASQADGPNLNTPLWMPEVTAFRQWAWPVLSRTQFGHTWLVLVVALVLSFLMRHVELRQRSFFGLHLQAAAGGIIAFLFTRLGHGGSFGFASHWFWLQAAHLLSVLLWLLSLGSLALRIFPARGAGLPFRFDRFTKVMNLAMPVILIAGTLRGMEVLPLRKGAGLEPYILVLCLKIVLVCVVAVVVSWMRKKSKSVFNPCDRKQWVNVFSVELVLAGVVVFLSSLLSQIAPP